MKQPRNAQCSCNSGKKFKKCCGNAADEAKRNQVIWQPPTQPPPVKMGSESKPDNAIPYRRRSPMLALLTMAAAMSMDSDHR